MDRPWVVGEGEVGVVVVVVVLMFEARQGQARVGGGRKVEVEEVGAEARRKAQGEAGPGEGLSSSRAGPDEGDQARRDQARQGKVKG